MSKHHDELGESNHPFTANPNPTGTSYADLAARNADTAFHSDADNINKVIRVESPLSFFILADNAPTWFVVAQLAADTIYIADGSLIANRVVTGDNGLRLTLIGYDLTAADFLSRGSVVVDNTITFLGHATGDGDDAVVDQNFFRLTPNDITIQDEINEEGLQYAADYSTNGELIANDRWVPDIAWVRARNICPIAVLDSSSVASQALVSGITFQLAFGASIINTTNADLAADGEVTINVAGCYEFFLFVNFQTASSSNRNCWVRLLVNGVQAGGTFHVKTTIVGDSIAIAESVVANFAVNDTVTVEALADGAGMSLEPSDPSVSNAAWTVVTTSQAMRLKKLEIQ